MNMDPPMKMSNGSVIKIAILEWTTARTLIVSFVATTATEEIDTLFKVLCSAVFDLVIT